MMVLALLCVESHVLHSYSGGVKGLPSYKQRNKPQVRRPLKKPQNSLNCSICDLVDLYRCLTRCCSWILQRLFEFSVEREKQEQTRLLEQRWTLFPLTRWTFYSGSFFTDLHRMCRWDACVFYYILVLTTLTEDPDWPVSGLFNSLFSCCWACRSHVSMLYNLNVLRWRDEVQIKVICAVNWIGAVWV